MSVYIKLPNKYSCDRCDKCYGKEDLQDKRKKIAHEGFKMYSSIIMERISLM